MGYAADCRAGPVRPARAAGERGFRRRLPGCRRVAAGVALAARNGAAPVLVVRGCRRGQQRRQRPLPRPRVAGQRLVHDVAAVAVPVFVAADGAGCSQGLGGPRRHPGRPGRDDRSRGGSVGPAGGPTIALATAVAAAVLAEAVVGSPVGSTWSRDAPAGSSWAVALAVGVAAYVLGRDRWTVVPAGQPAPTPRPLASADRLGDGWPGRLPASSTRGRRGHDGEGESGGG